MPNATNVRDTQDTQDTLHGLFFEAAAAKSDQICLKFGNHHGMTYAEVSEAVTKCAEYLAGLDDAPTIALVADRSYGLVISLLAVVRAGKAYCPMEPDFPPSRVGAMLAGADIKYAIIPFWQCPQPVLEEFPDLKKLLLHDNGLLENHVPGDQNNARCDTPLSPHPERLPQSIADSATAYVLFTSGSTGKPKGCMVPHRGSCLYAKEVVEKCHMNEDMVFLLKTPYVFDVSVQDIFSAFAAKGTLVIANPKAHRDAAEIADTIIEERVNCACFVPTLLVEFVTYLSMHANVAFDVRKHLCRVLTIGEALMTATCRKLIEHIPELEIHNLYGPTEASVGVSHFMVTKDTMPEATVVPIGKPFDYVRFKVFDPAVYEGQSEIKANMLQDVAPGETGELFIGGDCLAQGYINNPEKTCAAFFHFPEVLPRPQRAASRFSLYKTGDLCRVRPDGVFEYLGRNDFQVKIGGVRIECEEVSAVLQSHPAINDALVTAFEGPFGKTLAAYIITEGEAAKWEKAHGNESTELLEEAEADLEPSLGDVAKWGMIYDEMYKETDASISVEDPTLNWSGYIDTYSVRPHIEPVIQEWVEWSCEQVSSLRSVFESSRNAGRQCCITEIGCGNGMLLFRLAKLVGASGQGRYLGTDISQVALQNVEKVKAWEQYKHLKIDTAQLTADEIVSARGCKEGENDVVLCNGVTMYFPSTAYLLESMQVSVTATRPGGVVIFGDIQSKRHLLPFRAHVQTYQALRKPDSTARAVLLAAKQTAAREELSYFDDTLFARLDRTGCATHFGGRVARMELRLKRGWWHSEFNRFRYDVWLTLGSPEEEEAAENLELLRVSFATLSAELQLRPPAEDELVDPSLAEKLASWISCRVSEVPENVDGVVVQVPNARTLQSVRLLAWLEEAAQVEKDLKDLPKVLYPKDASEGSPAVSAPFGVEPETLFTMPLPEGWTQRVIWDEDPAFLKFVLLRDSAVKSHWLAAASEASPEPLQKADLSSFKNRREDVEGTSEYDPVKACNDALRAWALATSLLPAMRPAVYIPLESFPKNTAGKTDRAALPDPAKILEQISDAALIAYEAPLTEDEHLMVEVWEKVLKTSPVGVSTPFVAYGGHSLTAIQLCSGILAKFGQRADLVFLTSEDCTVRALLRRLKKASESPRSPDSQADLSCIVRLSPEERRTAMPLLIFGAAGTSAATYQVVAEQSKRLNVFAVELPGRGQRSAEPLEDNFSSLMEGLEAAVFKWAEQKRRFFVWGDSLGAVLAYEFARKWQASPTTTLMGLFVSGNAGPTVASRERGIGESVVEHLGLDRNVASCKEMTTEDWKRFLLASAAHPSNQEEMRKMFADPTLEEALVGPTRADCLAYESYHLDQAEKLTAPIWAMRGELDHITSPCAVKSWKYVAGGRWALKEFPKAGHMLARECPRSVAMCLDNLAWPDFTHELLAYKGYLTSYRLMRTAGIAPATGIKRQLSSSDIFSSVPQEDPDKENKLETYLMKFLPESITPQSPQVKIMRVGNAKWRQGCAAGNPMRNPN